MLEKTKEKISFPKNSQAQRTFIFCSSQSLRWSLHIVQKDVPRSRLSFTWHSGFSCVTWFSPKRQIQPADRIPDRLEATALGPRGMLFGPSGHVIGWQAMNGMACHEWWAGYSLNYSARRSLYKCFAIHQDQQKVVMRDLTISSAGTVSWTPVILD